MPAPSRPPRSSPPACPSCTTTTTFNPVADAYVSNAAGRGRHELRDRDAAPGDGDRRPACYLKFDLSTLPAGTVTGDPSSAYRRSPTVPASGAQAADPSWTESGINYTMAPAFSAATTSASAGCGHQAYAPATARTPSPAAALMTLVIVSRRRATGPTRAGRRRTSPSWWSDLAVPPTRASPRRRPA